MSVKWESCKGKRILYSDYSGLKTEKEMLDNLELEARLFKESKEPVLALDDFRNSGNVTSAFMARSKELAREVFSRNIRKNAILGAAGLRKVFMQAYNLFVPESSKLVPFETKEEALEYLVRD